ncbi:MAG: transaldolase, partial [Terriglobia bacterium]
MNRMRDLGKYGQAPWLDYIRRNLLVGGGLSRLIEEDHVTGVTSNPTIFEKAISGSDDYDAAIAELLRSNPHLSASQIFEHIALADIRSAADFLRQVFDRTGGADGFVSFELSPRLVEADELIGEGRRLWSAIDRPNVMLKVPATKPAARAIETLISEGININVTLLFSLSQYIRVAEAYLGGLEKTDNPESVASVASFFVSRVDAAADARLEETRPENSADLAGRLGVANCKVAYDRFKQIFRGKRWDDLASRGARPQRLLWASTSTKNPAFPDTKYVDELIGEQTVNTMPPSTIEAFCDHGRARPTLGVELEEAQAVSAAFKSLGIDPELLGEKLQEDGLAAFTASYDDFLSALEKKRRLLLAGRAGSMKLDLGPCEQEHADQLRRWKSDDYSARLWKKDKSLWGSEDDLEISNRLGWLWLPGLLSFADEVRSDGIQSVVLLGMGGSSLAPEVFQKVFGSADGYPALRVLDSTHPAAVRRVEDAVDLGRTLFIVASKSGTTVEPLSGFRYFWQKLEEQG